MKLKTIFAAVALLCSVGSWAYTTGDLESAGWTKVTAESITGTSDNYYMLVDGRDGSFVASCDATHYRPCFKTIANPVENPSFVWILEGSDKVFALKSYATGAYFTQADGWNTSMTGGSGSTTFTFTLTEGKYSLSANGRTDFVGHWNDNEAGTSDGEDIAANKAANHTDNFMLYAISKATFDAALVSARETAATGASESKPYDATAWIQNADWSGDWGGWARSGTWGNQQWGQKTLESWSATNVIVKQELRGVPNGKYRVSADVISGNNDNKVAYVFGTGSSKVSSSTVSAVASAGDYTTMSSEVAGNTLTADNIIVVNNTITIGVDQSAGWIVADNFKLYYLGEDLSIYVDAYNDAKKAAAAIDQEKPMLATVLSALQAAISDYGSGVDESDKAALQTATSALSTATSNAETSIAAYAPLAAVISNIDGILDEASSSTVEPTDYESIKTAFTNGTLANADVAGKITEAYDAIIPVIKSQNATTADFTYAIRNHSFEYGNTTGWTVGSSSDTGVRENSNNTYKTTGCDGDYLFNTWWQGIPMTQTLADIPNGEYTLTVSVASDGATIYLTANGEHNDGTETGGDNPGSGVFQEATFTFLVKDHTATIGVVGGANGDAGVHKDYVADGYWWYKADNFRLVKNRDLTPEEAFVAATDEDYAALNEAIEAYPIGFEANEYAPYNNVEALTALNAAKAIDQTANNSQEDVQAATDAITGATWTVNVAEVNAIWDGSFAYDYRSTTPSGNINPYGWQRVKDAAADGYNVRYQDGSNTGLKATSTGKALFTKQSAYYGYAAGYTMPLKSNTYYKVTFIYGGWGDCKKDGYVSMAAPDGSSVTLSATDLPLDATNADSNVGSWKNYSAIFQTGEEGNYVLGLRKKSYDTSGQSQYVYGDIVLVKATAADLKAALGAEISTAKDVDVTSNIGDGVFQKPASAVTALTGAISDAQTVYNNNDATVDEVIAATDALKTAEATFAAALNAPVAGKPYIIANKTANGALKIATESVTVGADAFVFFTAVEGGYVLSNANDEYILKTTGNNWTLSTTEEKASAYVISVNYVDGGFTISGAKGLFGTDATDAGSTVYANKAQANNGVWTITEASSANMKIDAANMYATFFAPFEVTIPSGVTASKVTAISDNVLTLTDCTTTIPANTPVVVKSESGVDVTFYGKSVADEPEPSLLTGVISATAAPVGSYVLQNNDDKVGFYQVIADNQPTVPANRAYLTVPPQQGSVKAFFFDKETGINGVLNEIAAGNIFDLSGRKVAKMQKGQTYIVGDKKVNVK